jgi:hypothetical protein
MLDKYLFIFLFVFGFSVSAQKLEGTVSDESGTVSDIMVVIKKKSNPDLIYKFTTTDTKGFYNFQLENISDSLTVQANGFFQESEIYPITPQKNNQNTIRIDLFVKSKSITIPEVIIEAKKRPISVKNDTTTYNPASFRDGSERVVEDLLKKLPGIEVKESGQILYKGRPIKKMLLDKEDLFDSQYTIGSRNIDVNMIDQVQAIDKFNENPLLKGLVDSDEVALNIKLVKGKSDISGNASLGYGIQDRYEGSVTGLLINEANKGFAVAGYNNIGTNSSPYDFRSSIQSLEMLEENKLRAKKIINEGNFYSQLDSKYHNRNSNFYTSANYLKKISKKLTFKMNFGFYRDDIKRNNNSVSEYLLNNQKLVIENTENLSKSPSVYNLNLFVENKKNKKLAWDFLSKFNYEEIDFRSRSLNNNEPRNSSVNSYSFYTKQNFNLTKRIDSISAYKILGIYSNGNSPQKFKLTPGFNLDEEQIGGLALQNIQRSKFRKEIFKFRADYIKKFDFFNWTISADYSFVNNNYNSNLTQTKANFEEFQNSDFQNHTKFKYHLPSVFSSFIRKVDKKYTVGFAVLSSFYNFDLEDNIKASERNASKFILSPVFLYSLYLNNYSNLTFTYKYSGIPPSEENLFSGIVLTGFRNFQNNEPNFEFIDSNSYSLEYDYNNLFKFNRLRIGFTHDNKKNNYFTRTNVNVENTINTMFFMPTSRRDYRLDVNAEKFIYLLRTYFKLYGSYGLGFDNNVVNGSDIRDVERRNLNLSLSITPKITDEWQFENKGSYISNSFYLDKKKTNYFESFENKSTLSYILQSGLRAKTIFNYLIPNLDYSDSYSFWDFEIEWSAKNKKIRYALTVQNLLNQKTFNTIYVTDFSSNKSSYNLLERYLLLKIYFSF